MTSDTNPPSVSIVIPVRNEVDNLARTIDACLAQDYGGPLEVIVADAMSDDGTRSLLERYADADESDPHPTLDRRRLRIVDNPGRSTPLGLNAAIRAATGDVIVRCDGHAVLPPDYVSRAVATLGATGAGNVGGVQKATGRTPVQRGIARAMSNPVGVGDARFHRGGAAGPVDTVYLGVFTREALDAVGGYDEALERNQDYELNVRLRDAGFVVWFDPGLAVEYIPRGSLRGLWRQYYDYGAWKRRVIGMHPGSLRLRQAAPPALVVVLAASGLSLATPLRPAGAVILIAYGLLVGAAGIVEAVSTKDAAGLLACPAIAVMHVAWGVGFILGRT